MEEQHRRLASNSKIEAQLGMPADVAIALLRTMLVDTAEHFTLSIFPVHKKSQVTAKQSKAESRALTPLFDSPDAHIKSDDSIVTSTDRDVQTWIIERLHSNWPTIPVLSEELKGAEQKATLAGSSRAIWILDPIDGTSNFVAGIPYYCTSLALVINGEVNLGLVYDPNRHECFYACKGCGAYLNEHAIDKIKGHRVNNTELSNAMALVDLKRLSTRLKTQLIVSAPYRSQRSFGASALDWCWIATGRCQLYLHGKQMLWDYAAGHLILDEAGGASSTLDNEALVFMNLSPRSVIAASNYRLYKAWREWLELHRYADDLSMHPSNYGKANRRRAKRA
ncbi:hypothetical protein A1OS_18610 [Enterovibrio norvegicus]|uniref:inositol monophosphatase family protein n=1 Tax=Enterovibrio norvegicus TaxID=188144 RepID=UPI0002E012BA|nr:inositol monophosphatase family protein [Enterovibrio norvegicus]OEE61979.1 hypothetical protein A1OS_18610 [Enterovibrio norvegicus]